MKTPIIKITGKSEDNFEVWIDGKCIGYNLSAKTADLLSRGACLALEKINITHKLIVCDEFYSIASK